MRDDSTSSLLAAVAAPVKRWPERRSAVLLSSVAMFVAIFLLREFVTGRGDALSLLYVIPIALFALELGIRAGVVAAIVSIGAMVTVETEMSWVGLLVRAIILLSVGTIAGRFSDRMRSHSARDESLLRSGLDLARLDETEDLLALLTDHIERAVEVSSVRVELDGSPAAQRGSPGGEKVRVPVVSREKTKGWIEVTAGVERQFSPEDRLILEAIALQAAVATENRRLLAVEREQQELHDEIERMRKRLGDQLRNASQLIEHHEQQRRGIAQRLHDEAAQAMAAALLTVGLLERGVDQEMSRPQLEDVRQQVKACIVDLRHIAGSLRPPALDEMGLAMALERFAEIEDERGVRSIDFLLGTLPPRLPSEVETATYRAIEEMLEALQGAGSVSVTLNANQEQVQVMIEARAELAAHAVVGAAAEPAEVHADLVATRARVELIGGSLHMSSMSGGGKRILVQIPIAPSSD
ncbi:MAG TPA: histidine kinase [Solirubrobacteraceae bacterium]|jgi:signal transduction histidine kinase|nr:histidine kinase [Solirubrobacteraceae bacterium]